MKTGTLIDLFPGGVFGAGFAAIAIICAGALWVQSERLESAQEDIALYQRATQSYADAQQTNLATIADLRERLRVIVEMQRLSKGAADRAAAHATDTIVYLNDQLALQQGKLDAALRKHPHWAGAGVPADIARRLPAGPDRAHGDGGSPRAGAGAAR